MKKYLNDDGKVGVLVSYGYGAGWSTWNKDEYREFFAMDKKLIEMKLNKTPLKEVEEYCKSGTGEDYTSMAGWNQAEIEWVGKGNSFCIEEYDGNESLRFINDLSMTA